MNEKNLNFLFDQAYRLGFADTLNAAIKDTLSTGPEKATVPFSHSYDNDSKKVEGTLNFSKSKNTDYQFLNSFDATLYRDNTEVRGQHFRISAENNNLNFTRKEAFNLLDGRFVFKDVMNANTKNIQPAWVGYDFKNAPKDEQGIVRGKPVFFYEGYGFNLEKALEKLNIKNWDDSKVKEDILKGLKKGDVRRVTVTENNAEVKMDLSANPRFREVKKHVVQPEENSTKQKGVSPSEENTPAKVSAAEEDNPSAAQKKPSEKKKDTQENTAEKKPKRSRKRGIGM